jgi:hypothetical protein
MEVLPFVFGEIRKNGIKVLLRNDVFELIQSDFPYKIVDIYNHDFIWKTLSFLSEVSWMNYAANYSQNLHTKPEIVKDYFNQPIKNEVSYQVKHLSNQIKPENKFLTYRYFWNNDDDLTISKSVGGEISEIIVIETLIYNNLQDIEAFFAKQKNRFEHNPKHDKYKAKGNISPLRCYNERTGDKTQAQKLLETSILLNGDYYNYDENNNVYVVFVITVNKLYHGFDLSDEGENVPVEIKNRFNKDGRRF